MKPESSIQKCTESSNSQGLDSKGSSKISEEFTRDSQDNNNDNNNNDKNDNNKAKEENILIPNDSPKNLSTIPSEVIYSILSTSVDTQEYRKPSTFSLRFKDEVEEKDQEIYEHNSTSVDPVTETEDHNYATTPVCDKERMVPNDKPKKSLFRFCCVKWSNITSWNSEVKYKRLEENTVDTDKY